MSIQNKEKKKTKKVFALDFVSNEIKRLCMYNIFFFYGKGRQDTNKQKSLFTVLTEETSIPDDDNDDDKWDK